MYVYIKSKFTKQWMETELSHEAAFRNTVPPHGDVHWLPHICRMDEHSVCSVTGELC